MEKDTPKAAAVGTPSVRLGSIDTYRGLAMFLMMAEVLQFRAVSAAVPDSGFWRFLGIQQTHVQWTGCSVHDLIQPSFTFLVGVALPFSIARRRASGQSMWILSAHAFWRAFLLVALGIFLRSIGRPQTYFTFEDTLTQIGLGYGFLFLLGFRPVRDQWIALVMLLVGYWAAFALFPLPGPEFDYARVGVSGDWLREYGLSGFAAHWNKNSNFAWWFDTWFLNLFPGTEPFTGNYGGYSTLSFIPTLGTMILGLLAGEMLRSERTPWAKVGWLSVCGLACLTLGLGLDGLGICPSVKCIWTPSWTLFSGGWCFLILAACYAVIDIHGWRAWAFPLVVIGMNSIVAYCSDHVFVGFIGDALKRHIGSGFFTMFGAPYEPFILGASILFMLWLMLLWMYRKKMFIRI